MIRLVPTPKTPFHIRPFVPAPAPAPVVPIAVAAPFERSPEGIITAAANGNPVARKLLRPIVLELARASTVYLDDAESLTNEVLASIRRPGGLGRPRPGNAVRWLENVTRAFAKHDFETTCLEEEESNAKEDDGGNEG